MFQNPIVTECLPFLNDIPRNTWYRDQIARLVPNKRVMEIGCGPGLLAAYCLEHGANQYYGIDIRSNRVRFTQDLLADLGYQGRFEIWTDDFCQLAAHDLPRDIDLLLCEQTGHQFQNNFSIKKFWQHAKEILPPGYISLPDEWGIDVEVYAGEISDRGGLMPGIFLNDESLPRGYFQSVQGIKSVKPVFDSKSLLALTPANADKPIRFMLDLRGYQSATVVISDYVAYQSERCPYASATTFWPGPIALTVPDAGAMIEFFWDDSLRQGPAYTKGFWSYRHVT